MTWGGGAPERVLLYPGATDFRRGIPGLLALVGGGVPGTAYCFCSADRRSVKVLEVGEGSVWLHLGRLRRGRFPWPAEGEASRVSAEDIEACVSSGEFVSRVRCASRNRA